MCSQQCAKIILIVFNFLFFVGGALLLAFGIAGLANPEGLQNFLVGIPGVKNMSEIIDIPTVIISSSVFMIVLGAILVVFGFLGCCGAWFNSKPMLVIYWVLLLLVILAEVALIIVAAVSPAKMETETTKLMYRSLHDRFQPVSFHNDKVHLPSDVVAISWVSMQFEVGCCGVYNYTDYTGFTWNNTFLMPDNSTLYSAHVPPSCCKVDSDKSVPKNSNGFNSLSGCLNGDVKYIYTEGCYASVLELIYKYSYIPISICAIVIFVEIVAIVAAVYLWKLRDDLAKPNKSGMV